MKRLQILAIPLLVVLVLLLGMGAGACSNGEETPPPPEQEEEILPPEEEEVAPPSPEEEEIAPTPLEEEEEVALPPPEEEEEIAPKPALPKSGEWTASTGGDDFSFTFTVSPEGTGITDITYNMFAFKCAGWVQTVISSTINKSPPWPITNGQFIIEASDSFGFQGPTLEIVIQGSFNETRTQASGTWEISRDGKTCPGGTWESSPGS